MKSIVYKQPKEEIVRRWFVKLKQGAVMMQAVVPDTPEWIAAADKYFSSFTPIEMIHWSGCPGGTP